jgi:hypothetical protein
MKSPATDTILGLLYSRLANWNSISDFEQAMQDYFSGKRSQAEIADFRTKRATSKVLRDEVSPVLHHLRFVKAKGEVKFAFDNTVPDCWLREDPNAKPRGLEVTVAQSREQHYLGTELNEKRMGRGFLGLPDSASSKAFSDRLARPRVMYSTGSALEVIGNGIKSCLKKKDDPKYAGFDLLIEAPLQSLPNERWNQIQDDLRSAASGMPFREIHVIGNQDTEPFGFRIK